MPKEPQDHKPKAGDEAEDGLFVFEHKGVTFTSSKTIEEVVSPGFLRRNRKLPEMDFYFTMLEGLFDGNVAAIGVIDGMTWGELATLTKSLEQHMQRTIGASLGE